MWLFSIIFTCFWGIQALYEAPKMSWHGISRLVSDPDLTGHWYRSVPPELQCHFPQAVDIQEGDPARDGAVSTITMSKAGWLQFPIAWPRFFNSFLLKH